MFQAHIPFNLPLHSFKATVVHLIKYSMQMHGFLPGGDLAWLVQWMSSFKCILFLKLFTG